MRTVSMLRFPVMFLLLVIPFFTRAQAQLSDSAYITLLTCGPGNELYSVFGHTAIRVADPARGTDVVYNFGTFDFDTPNFYLKFVKGDLQYFVSVAPYQDFVYTYQYYNRDVFEQKLNLSPEQKQQVADELYTTLNSDKKFYTYKYFHRNCTTMVADILNSHLAEKIAQHNEDSGKSYRRIVVERLHNSFYENLGISLIFGAKTDVELSNLFLPVHLLQGIEGTKLANGQPLAEQTITVYKSTANTEKSGWNNIYTFIGVCIVLMVLTKNIVVRRVLYAIFGLLGIFFCFVGLYSFHIEVTQNYNALLVNPLFLVLLYFSFARKQNTLQRVAVVILACVLAYVLFMLTKAHLPLVLPLVGLILVMLIREVLPLVKSSFPQRRENR